MKDQAKKRNFLGSNTALVIATVVAGLCIFPQSAYAIFGFGDIVFDPSSLAVLKDVWSSSDSIAQKTTETYTQVVSLVRGVQQLHEFEQQMAAQLHQNVRQMLITQIQPIIANYTRNQAGETAQWTEVLNGRPDMAANAWKNSTLPLTADATNKDLTSTPGFDRFLPDIATVEEQDGSATQCLAVLGQYRKSAADNTAALQNLESTVADESSATNSNIEQANEMNLANTQALNEQRAQGQLKACQVQQQMIANEYQRNLVVDDLNMQAKVQADRQKNPGGIGEMSNILENYVP